jgi:AcrR family transcriptional regulator
MITRITKRQDTEVRQKQIINAAREIIAKHGSEHVTVRSIAEAVDISEAAIYRHFEDKQAIFALLIDDIEEKLTADFNPVSSNGSSLKMIEEGLRGPLSVKRRGVSFQVISEIVSLGDKKLNKRISELINAYIERLTGLLSQGIESGEVKADLDTRAAATILFGMMHGLANIWALSGYSFDSEERYETLWKVFREAVITRKN